MGEDPIDMGSPSDATLDKVVSIYPDGQVLAFATNLHAVFGLQYIDGKVYVHHTPEFSVFEDFHGMGINRKDIITNDNPHPWSPSFNDHIPAGFKLAMDGYFYFTTGDKGIKGAVGSDGRKIEMHGGGVYRMRPDGTGLEVYSTGTRNHLDPAINSEDEIFTYDNTDDGGGWWKRVTHMVDGGFYGYPYDFKPQRPYTLWRMDEYGGGAPTGAIAYNEDALPDEYKGNLFMCDWGGEVLRLQVERDGAT
jgi:glucose/arabinose dehydrogenase